MLAIALALGSSACYGVSNFVGPQLAKRHALVAVLLTSQVAALVACVAYVAIDGSAPLSAHDTSIALLAGVGNAFGLIGFYKAAELGPLSVVAPIGALGAIVPVLWGLLGGEALSLHSRAPECCSRWAAARSPRGSRGGGDRYEDPRASLIWAAGSAVAFGVFLTALPQVSDDGRAWALLDARVALVVRARSGRAAARRRCGRRRASLTLSIPGLLLVAGTRALHRGRRPRPALDRLGARFPLPGLHRRARRDRPRRAALASRRSASPRRSAGSS